MKNFKSILCPFDFSEYSNEALLYALQLAGSHTQITLFHALNMPTVTDPNGMVYFEIDTQAYLQGWQTKMAEHVAQTQQAYPQHSIKGEVRMAIDLTDAILDMQKEIAADLIIMGSHGRSGLSRIVMGSVAESVLREATCPVLIVRPPKA